MTEIVQLSPEALAEARAEAVKLETHAYEVSKDMYVQNLTCGIPGGHTCDQASKLPGPSGYRDPQVNATGRRTG